MKNAGHKPLISLKANKASLPKAAPLGTYPDSLDWTERGYVTSVKDQGSCGSCWAFGTTAQAESTLIFNGLANNSIDLSEQYVLECSEGSDCDGTYYVSQPMDAILGGIPTEELHPYTPFNYQNLCGEEDKIFIANDYDEYSDVSEEQIVALLQEGPLVTTISADNWEYYGSGIFQCPSYAGINHVVMLTGYTS